MTEVTSSVIPDPTFTYFTSDVTHPVFSHDGSRLGGVCKKKNIGIWNISGKDYGIENHKTTDVDLTCLAFSPINHDVIAVSGNHVTEVVRVNGSTPFESVSLVRHNRDTSSCAFFPDGKSVLSAARDGQIRILNFETKQVTNNLECNDSIRNVLIAPDGTYFLAVTENGNIIIRRPWYFGIWIQRYLERRGKENTASQSVTISPDSRSVAYIVRDNSQMIGKKDLKTKKTSFILHHLPHHSITSVTYVCGGRFLLVTTTARTFYVYDVITGAQIKFINGFSKIEELVCSPSGRYLAIIGSGLSDGSSPGREGLWLLDFGRPHLGTLTNEEALLFV